MVIEGFVEYKRREFCKKVSCPVQLELSQLEKKSEEYEKVRQTCMSKCRYTTWEFHHWLIEKGYIIIVNCKSKNNRGTVLANIDKDIIKWIDRQVQTRKYRDRSHLVESVLVQYKKAEDNKKA